MGQIMGQNMGQKMVWWHISETADKQPLLRLHTIDFEEFDTYIDIYYHLSVSFHRNICVSYSMGRRPVRGGGRGSLSRDDLGGRQGRGNSGESTGRNSSHQGSQHDNSETNAITGEAMLQFGLLHAGFNADRQKVVAATNIRRFRAFYGVGPNALSALYNDLPGPKKDPMRFLMAVKWLMLYDTEHVLSGRWALLEETLRSVVKEYIDRTLCSCSTSSQTFEQTTIT
jgi:hypothetical protein